MPQDTAFDDDGKPILATGFDYGAIDAADREEQDLEALRAEVILLTLRNSFRREFTPLQTHRNGHIMLFLLNRGDHESLTDLARYLNVSAPRMTALVKSFKRKFPMFSAISDRTC